MRCTLIHEMAHVATNNYHGGKFRTEMQRLSQSGAPVEEADLREGLQYVTRAEVEGTASQYFCEFPGDSVREAVGRIGRERYNMTAKAFKRRFPWATQAISAVRADVLSKIGN
jgi:hypothetical protein